MSRALVMAMAAWPASARMRSASASSKASGADGVDLDDPERAALAGDRRGDHRAEAGALVELCRLGRRREQVARSSPAITTRSSATATPVAPTPTEIQSLARSSSRELLAEAVVERPVQVARGRVEQVEDRALPADEAAGQLDDLLEDLGRVAQGGDAGGDLAQGLLGAGPAGEPFAGPVELRR